MRDVSIVGVGSTPVGEFWSTNIRELGLQALQQAMADANVDGVDALYVGNTLGGALNSQLQLGPMMADYAGLHGIETFSVNAGEASGGAALRTGYLAVASGAVEVAAVLGVEKVSDTVGNARLEATQNLLNADYEAVHGATPTTMAALLMRLYMETYDLELAQFEGFSINAHLNGSKNPGAMFRNIIKPGRFATAPVVAPPVNLFDSAPEADGAAALILMASDRVSAASQSVRITGSAAASDVMMLADRREMLFFKAANISGGRAMQQAGITAADVDLFELHDSFTVVSALSLEACGFAEVGAGWRLAADGELGLDGVIPISTFGGLKARGNPYGAVGVYQAVETVAQLRGTAGDNQVAGARTALIQNLGGLAANAITHVLQY